MAGKSRDKKKGSPPKDATNAVDNTSPEAPIEEIPEARVEILEPHVEEIEILPVDEEETNTLQDSTPVEILPVVKVETNTSQQSTPIEMKTLSVVETNKDSTPVEIKILSVAEEESNTPQDSTPVENKILLVVEEETNTPQDSTPVENKILLVVEEESNTPQDSTQVENKILLVAEEESNIPQDSTTVENKILLVAEEKTNTQQDSTSVEMKILSVVEQESNTPQDSTPIENNILLVAEEETNTQDSTPVEIDIIAKNNLVEEISKSLLNMNVSELSDVQQNDKGLEQLSIDQKVEKITDDLSKVSVGHETKDDLSLPKIVPTVQKPEEKLDNQKETIETLKKPGTENATSEESRDNIGPTETVSSTESAANTVKKHVFRNPDSYKEFTPKKFTIQVDDSSSSDSSVRASRSLPTLRNHPPHSFLTTIDTVLMIMECTLTGAYRISQQCAGPTIPLVVANTMQSVRLALETLKIHFGYTRQQNFEPLASILRELLIPAVELFSYICPELKFPDIQHYRSIDEGFEPELSDPSEEEYDYLMPRQMTGMVYFQPHPVPIPKGPPRIALFMDNNRDPNLGAFATANGFIRLQLPYTFQIDLTIDGAICVRNLRDKTTACISSCGNFSALETTMTRVHQHNLVSEIRINDEFVRKNMFAKMGVRGIQFGGSGCPQNAHLKDDGSLCTTDASFAKLDTNYIRDVFINHSTNGPEQYDACCDALKECKTKTLTDGSLHFYWKDIKITQYSNGEVTVARNHWNFMIWYAPEILHIKKGVVKIVTPVSRMVTTIINSFELHKEKYFLANLGQMWVYYTARDYIVSNEVYSAGYNNENNDDDYLLDEAAGYQE